MPPVDGRIERHLVHLVNERLQTGLGVVFRVVWALAGVQRIAHVQLREVNSRLAPAGAQRWRSVAVMVAAPVIIAQVVVVTHRWYRDWSGAVAQENEQQKYEE